MCRHTFVCLHCSQDVGDHSAFVGDISERLPKQFEPIARHLSKIHYRFFCDKFVQSFVARFVSEVHKCRKISERGAQQLLLDTALIKTTLLEAPVVAGHGRQMPTAYSNYVLKLGYAFERCESEARNGQGRNHAESPELARCRCCVGHSHAWRHFRRAAVACIACWRPDWKTA